MFHGTEHLSSQGAGRVRRPMSLTAWVLSVDKPNLMQWTRGQVHAQQPEGLPRCLVLQVGPASPHPRLPRGLGAPPLARDPSTGTLLQRPGFPGHPDFWPGLGHTVVVGNTVSISGSWLGREPSGPIRVGSRGQRRDI